MTTTSFNVRAMLRIQAETRTFGEALPRKWRRGDPKVQTGTEVVRTTPSLHELRFLRSLEEGGRSLAHIDDVDGLSTARWDDHFAPADRTEAADDLGLSDEQQVLRAMGMEDAYADFAHLEEERAANLTSLTPDQRSH